MQIIWRFLGQRPRLEALEATPLSPGVEQGPQPGDNRDRYERVVAHETPGPPEPGGPFERLARAVRAYEVFPPRLVSGVLKRSPVEAGDIYGICYHLLPGVDLFFGGRVTHSFHEETADLFRAGFRFRTLQGHPELGEETFAVEKDKRTGAVTVSLESWSRPGHWLTRLAKPFTRRTQVRASFAALDHLGRVAAGRRDPPAV